MITAPARTPKAIHPACDSVLVLSLFFEATAAPAAAAAPGPTLEVDVEVVCDG
jgi:hypothetical protein